MRPLCAPRREAEVHYIVAGGVDGGSWSATCEICGHLVMDLRCADVAVGIITDHLETGHELKNVQGLVVGPRPPGGQSCVTPKVTP